MSSVRYQSTDSWQNEMYLLNSCMYSSKKLTLRLYLYSLCLGLGITLKSYTNYVISNLKLSNNMQKSGVLLPLLLLSLLAPWHCWNVMSEEMKYQMTLH